MTEACKSTPDVAEATRRALHRGTAGDKDAVGDERRQDVMVYTMVYTYIYIIQYTMIHTNDIYRGMSCITYGI